MPDTPQKQWRREWYYRNRKSTKPLRPHTNSRRELVCFGCGKRFIRIASRHRNREGNRVFCSVPCYRSHSNDDLSPFRFIFNRISRSLERNTKTLDCDISPEFLLQLWDKQDGRCAYSGVKMILPAKRKSYSPLAVSVDRIDSSSGYTENNVELVCRFVNMGKNSFSKEEINNFFRLVADENAAASKPV